MARPLISQSIDRHDKVRSGADENQFLLKKIKLDRWSRNAMKKNT